LLKIWYWWWYLEAKSFIKLSKVRFYFYNK